MLKKIFLENMCKTKKVRELNKEKTNQLISFLI